MRQVFISYSHQDRRFVKNLAAHLQQAGIKVVLDIWAIGIGERIKRRVEEAILGSSYFVLIASPDSMASDWVKAELDTAINLELNGKLAILIVQLRPCAVHPLMAGKLLLKAPVSVKKAAKLLLEAMQPTVFRQFGTHRIVDFAGQGGSVSFRLREVEVGVPFYEVTFSILNKGAFAGIFWEPLTSNFDASKFDCLTWDMLAEPNVGRIQIKIETKGAWVEQRVPFASEPGWHSYSLRLGMFSEADFSRVERVTVAMDDRDIAPGLTRQTIGVRSFSFQREHQ